MKKSHIFIIEDCDTMRQFLTSYLSNLGEVQAFSTGQEALDAFSLDNWPDVIVLDLNLPDMTGYEILDVLNKKQLMTRSRVIVLSGENESNSRIACLTAGASDYLMKPFHPRELQLRMQNAIGATINNVA